MFRRVGDGTVKEDLSIGFICRENVKFFQVPGACGFHLLDAYNVVMFEIALQRSVEFRDRSILVC